MNANYLNLAEIATQVKVRMQDVFRAYPVTVQSSPDDMLVLCIRVFAVPENKIDEVQAFIFDLQDSLIAKTEVMLLPMVKNLEVTRQHYPEYMPLEPAVSVGQIAEQFSRKTTREPSKWQVAPYSSSYSRDHTIPMQTIFGWDKSTVVELHSARNLGKEVAANTELAIAA